jgi:hypothetical protein
MQTIETRYHSSTTCRPSKITATASGSGKRISVSPRGESTDSEDHTEAARALCEKLGWCGKLIGGHIKRGMVWVFASSNSPTFTVKNPEHTP